MAPSSGIESKKP